MKKTIYFENLDGLRFFAFLGVFSWHCFGYLNYHPSNFIENFFLEKLFGAGYLGVNFFFVLSGFLITYLLTAEREKKGFINIIFFYFRRILRIWPLYYSVLIIGFFVFPYIALHNIDTISIKEHLLQYAFFINNFDRIKTSFTGIGNDNLGVLWSIAVEEQFYLVWPILLSFIPMKRWIYLFFSTIVLSIVFRIFFIDNYSIIYLHTISIISDFAIGGIIAYYAFYSSNFILTLKKLSRITIATIYLLGIMLIMSIQTWNQIEILKICERLILSLFFAFIILEQTYSEKSLFKISNMKLISKLGIYTYGLYCLHLFSISFIQKINISFSLDLTSNNLLFYLEFMVCLALSSLVCFISYNYFEKYFLILKNKYKSV